ncbi:aminopeptidase P family protein, partial [Planktomarina temperata]|nr:aminopeptidase P family protein [Planktomarina temperata]
MTEPFRENRKIDPSRGALTGDNTPNDMDRVEIGPTKLAFDEWAAAGLELPDLQHMRRFRHNRLVQGVNGRDYGALVVFDPLNIRYASDSTNMQLWNTHNPFRALIVCAD